MAGTLRVRVVGTDLPGLVCTTDGVRREPVYVGIQRGKEVIEMTPADRPRVTFDAEFAIGMQPDGEPNFLGPYAQGSRQDRFFYLSWGSRAGAHFTMFRRLKIRLGHLTLDRIRAAIAADSPITVHLKLTDRKGAPLCATPPPTYIRWE